MKPEPLVITLIPLIAPVFGNGGLGGTEAWSLERKARPECHFPPLLEKAFLSIAPAPRAKETEKGPEHCSSL